MRDRCAIQDLPPAAQQKAARLAWLYGQWIGHEAESHGLPLLEARPMETLFDRVAALL